MVTKKYDIVAKVGSYVKDGKEKGEYLNVGVLMEKDGRPFILLNKTFNPAGLNSDKNTVLLSLFEPKERSSQPSNNTEMEVVELDDEVPF